MSEILLPEDLESKISRLNEVLKDTQDVERFTIGLGIRLALGMAVELRDALPLGSQTAELVKDWTEHHGIELTEKAIAFAREFLIQPERLKKEFAKRLEESGWQIQ